MWNKPTDKDLAALPGLYETEGIGLEEKVIHMHFFIGNCDWYAAEYDPESRRFFGYAILGGDYENAEWGYFSLDEFLELEIKSGGLVFEIDRDLDWRPRPALEVDKICRGCGWRTPRVVYRVDDLAVIGLAI